MAKNTSSARRGAVSNAAVTAAKSGRKPSAKAVPAVARKSVVSAKSRRAAARSAAPAAAPKASSPELKNIKLTVTQQRKYRDLLTAIRARLASQISEHRSESLRREDGVNVEEDGTDAFDRQFTLGLVSAEHDLIFEIEEAERRLTNGSYGLCELCSSPIEPLRLQAIPFVRNCVRCQSEREGRRGNRRDMMGAH
jgi:DnaK suppressor protein